jgi:hypothetical protein
VPQIQKPDIDGGSFGEVESAGIDLLASFGRATA